MHFHLDGEGVLHPLSSLELDSPVNYVWPHPQRRLLYVASSARWFTPRDEDHMLSLVEVLPEGGLRRLGVPIPLPTRPIHLTLDPAAQFLLTLFNAPAGLQVRALAPDGAIGAEVEQEVAPDPGIFPHHVLVDPVGGVLVTARGNNPQGDRPEEPGSLQRFDFAGGQLRLAQVVAPDGGYGFGPRHCAYHPNLPCLYVSVERQNQIHVYRHENGVIEDRPRQILSTLAPGKAPQFPQFAGAVHVDAAGGFVHVGNRDDPHKGMEASHITGDNTMASFRIDPRTGALAPPVHSEFDAYHVRTFSLSPPFLVAASQSDITLPGPEGPRTVPASLTVFRLDDDGRLVRVHRRVMETGPSMLFWCGFPAAYGADWG